MSNINIETIERRTNPDVYGAIAPPMTFLSLAPTTSSSYPLHRRSSSATTTISASVPTLDATTASNESAIIEEPASNSTSIANPIAGEIALTAARTRRTSSMTSNGSNAKRFLKLGPIHGWEDHSDVWSEVAE